MSNGHGVGAGLEVMEGADTDGGESFDPSAEIHDIDSRLQALQSFLDAARASGVGDSPSPPAGKR